MSNNKIFMLLAVNILLIFSIMVSIFPIAPLISSELGMTSSEIGSIAGIASLVMTFLSIPSGVLADRYGRKKIILSAMILSAVAVFMVAASHGVVLFTAGWLLFGFARGFVSTPMYREMMQASGIASLEPGQALDLLEKLLAGPLERVIFPVLGTGPGTQL